MTNRMGDAVAGWVAVLVGITPLANGCIETGEPAKSNVTFKRSTVTSPSSDFDQPVAPPRAASGGRAAATGAGPTALPPKAQSGGAGGMVAQPSAGAAAGGIGGSVAGADGATVTPPPSAPVGPIAGTLKVSFTSVDLNGRYSPRNCGAVWIETPSGEFVKTIERWCGFRAYYLERWTEASGGWGGGRSFFGTTSEPSPDQMDAVSSGTLRMITPHESTWNSRNVEGELLPDGEYKLVIEVSDGDEESLEVPFTKGAEAFTLMQPDELPCVGLVIDYQPGAAP